MIRRLLALVAVSALSAGETTAWPCFRGPNHDGTIAAPGALAGAAPKVLWKAKTSFGFSGVTVVDGLAWTISNLVNVDTVWCFDAVTGKEVWKHSYPCRLSPKYYEGGPSATPSWQDGVLYTLSKDGDLHAFDARTGAVRWMKQVADEVKATRPDWGFSGSPLVLGDLLLLNVGEFGCAIERATGAVRWKSGPKAAGYATPVSGGGGVLLFAHKSLVAVDPATGTLLWQHAWKIGMYEVNAADPLPIGERVFVASGHDFSSAVLAPAAGSVQEVWRSKVLCTTLNAAVHLGGHLYGFGGDRLKCVDAATGSERWAHKGLGQGTLIAVDGTLVILSEKGELVIAAADTTAFKPLIRTQVLGGKCWTAPAFADGRIYCRNADGDVVAVGVK